MITSQKIFNIGSPDFFEPYKIFNCGQCFRFEKNGDNSYEGVAYGKYICIQKTDDQGVLLHGADKNDFDSVWRNFLDIDTDYSAVTDTFSQSYPIMEQVSQVAKGIRILRQEPWETLCSFIISQNNNIPRIKKIINALCRAYGTPVVSPDGREFYTFPSPQRLFEAGESEIFSFKTGFRAKYIYDAAKKVVSGEIDLQSIYDMDTASATEYLKKIKGVGDKVASCVLLFCYHKTDSFPIDVWVKKIIRQYFDGNLPQFGKYAGIAQQYLFYYERYIVNDIKI